MFTQTKFSHRLDNNRERVIPRNPVVHEPIANLEGGGQGGGVKTAMSPGMSSCTSMFRGIIILE